MMTISQKTLGAWDLVQHGELAFRARYNRARLSAAQKRHRRTLTFLNILSSFAFAELEPGCCQHEVNARALRVQARARRRVNSVRLRRSCGSVLPTSLPDLSSAS